MAFSDHLHAKDWTFEATSRIAQRRREFALYILIASLAMFFFTAVLGYLIIRMQVRDDLPPIELPSIFWLSTALAIVGSGLLWRALRSVRRERQGRFRGEVLVAFLFGAAFCVTQSIGMSTILNRHFETQFERLALPSHQAEEEETPDPPAVATGEIIPANSRSIDPGMSISRNPAGSHVGLDGLLFVLILMHALHFGAGMIALTVVTLRSLMGRYDHEYHSGVKLCAIYWRFLDVVWIAFFGAFLLAR